MLNINPGTPFVCTHYTSGEIMSMTYIKYVTRDEINEMQQEAGYPPSIRVDANNNSYMRVQTQEFDEQGYITQLSVYNKYGYRIPDDDTNQMITIVNFASKQKE